MAQCQLSPAVTHVLAHDRFEVVNVVEVHVVKALHLWIDVARHGDIDEDQWAIPTPCHPLRHVGALKNHSRAASRSHNDIRVRYRREAILKSYSSAAELASQLD